MRLWVLLLVCVITLMGCSAPEQRDIIPPASSTIPETQSMDSLSAEAQQAFLAKVAATQNVAVDQLQVMTVKEADWPDACLGLAGPDELCAQMVIPGWAITVSSADQLWSYRTDLEMELVKLEPQG